MSDEVSRVRVIEDDAVIRVSIGDKRAAIRLAQGRRRAMMRGLVEHERPIPPRWLRAGIGKLKAFLKGG